ncbi:MAG: ATP-binding protein [Pseudomonadota bacterium]
MTELPRKATRKRAADRPDPPRRLRDLGVITAIAAAILALLAISGALGWVEAVTAVLVLSAAALAYFVGSSQPPDLERADRRTRGRTGAGRWAGPDLEGALDALPIPALYIGTDRRIALANAPARDLFRLREDQKTLAASVMRNPALLDCLEAALSEMARPGRAEVPWGPSGDELWLAHVAPLQGERRGALIVMEDHTPLRRAERARSDFLANASHELRTPLTSLAGFIETMRGPARQDPEAWDHFLDIMFEQTERMKRLIKDLLSLSRIEFREHTPPSTIEDLASLLAQVLATMAPLADERGVSLASSGPAEGLLAVADYDEITQVAQNLISNAVKYSSLGDEVVVSWGLGESLDAASAQAGRQWSEAGRITLLQASDRGGGPGLWLRVEDRGPGIDREHLPRLGQRFYRVEESRGGERTGTGLGLAIVKHVMTRHRGGLIVETAPGHGSAFGVWFPGLAAQQPVAAAEPTTPLQASHDALAEEP